MRGTQPDLTSESMYLFHEGTYAHAYRTFGAREVTLDGQRGVIFVVWAPRARQVRVVGDFNGWRGAGHPLCRRDGGVWSGFVPGLRAGELYKYEIEGSAGEWRLKADPFAFASETPPETASRVAALGGYAWGDAEWLAKRNAGFDQPMAIYEVHLGSWRRAPGNRVLTYRELASQLVDYAADMGYTHIELLPIAEHPYDGSWGYQVTGFYAVTGRYGRPEDFKYFVDRCHQKGLGVILDWVPSHFCKDAHGLSRFDGEPLYEPANPLWAETPWDSLAFDFSRPEVRSFLLSNALFWFDEYHIDGLRVDAVSHMLYYDVGRRPGEWAPNPEGGRENWAATEFLRLLNRTVFQYFPSALMIAEESSAHPKVTHPVDVGGLGFNYKWNMGWMNDVLTYASKPPEERRHAHNQLTFSMLYAFSENFILPLSHDEVVHGKRSLYEKMPGDYGEKFLQLRALMAYMMAHPGKKLLFMGGDFAHVIEWKYDDSLDWHLLEYETHRDFHRFMRSLIHLYRACPALWEQDCSWEGFEWIEPDDAAQSVLVFIRRAKRSAVEPLVIVCNFGPASYERFRIGVPAPGSYRTLFSSKDGIQEGRPGGWDSEPVPWHNRSHSVEIALPRGTVLYLSRQATPGSP